MPAPRVLVSSTAYDLKELRSSLRDFIRQFGFDPVVSESSDILYDPDLSTHDACIEAVKDCDMVVLVVGSRFGSELSEGAVDRFATTMDLELLFPRDSTKQRLSITQAEALTAVENNIPVYAFIDRRVHQEYQLYQKNPALAAQIDFPSIEKPGTAGYIFSFIEYLKRRETNNSISTFEYSAEIRGHLEKQWSFLFKKLLKDARERRAEEVQLQQLGDQFRELKEDLLARLAPTDYREVATTSARYHDLLTFVGAYPGLGDPFAGLAASDVPTWEERLGLDRERPISQAESTGSARSVLHRRDGTSYSCRLSVSQLGLLAGHWKDFARLDPALRSAVVSGFLDAARLNGRVLTSDSDLDFVVVRRPAGVTSDAKPYDVVPWRFTSADDSSTGESV